MLKGARSQPFEKGEKEKGRQIVVASLKRLG